MKKLILLTLIPSSIFAQVGINTNIPTSTLDITAKAPTGAIAAIDGLLIPRVDRQRAQLMTTAPISTLIYVNDISTGLADGAAIEITSIGFYYFDGAKWTTLITNTNNNDWHLTGNAGTNPANNFIGTTDTQNVVFKRNNQNSGHLGSTNTSFGVGSLPPTTPTILNSAFGTNALASTTGGVAASAFGANALTANTTGSNTVAFGYNALSTNTTGQSNTAIGAGALTANTTGGDNVAVGKNTLDSAVGAASYNVAVGADALGSITTGNTNVAIGDNAGNAPTSGAGGTGLTSGSNNVLIGANTVFPTATGSNQLNIVNTIFGTNIGTSITNITGNIGIGTSAPTTRLHVAATTANANRYNLFDATAGTNQYGILTLRNTSPLATGNYSLLGFTNSGTTSGGGNWALGSIRTGAAAVNGSEEDFFIGNSTGGGLNERLRIKPDTGFVGIGTSAPTARVEIASGTAGTSGLKFTNINNTTATTQNAAALGVDATGNVVIQNNAPLTSTFKSFSINASAPTASLISIGTLEFRFPLTTCTGTTDSYMQVRSTSGTNNLGILHGMIKTAQDVSSIVNTTTLTTTPTFTNITSLPLNCVQDGHAQFNFYSYTDRTFYRVNINIADGDSLGFGALGYIFAELQR